MVRLSLSAILVIALVGSASAQVQLKYKIPENSKWLVTGVTKAKQTIKVLGQEVNTQGEQVAKAQFTSGKRKADGTLDVQSTIASLKAKSVLPGDVELNYDSKMGIKAQGTQFDSLLEVFDAIAKMKTTYVYNKDNHVAAVKLDDKALAKMDETAKKLTKGQLQPSYLKEVMNKEIDSIPSKAVKVGDTWKQTATVRLGGGQSMTFETVYKYEGTTKKDGKSLDKISTKTISVSYAQDNAEGPVKVTGSKLKIADSKGVILFDRDLGQIVLQEDEVGIQGEITMDIGGNEQKADLNLVISSKKQRE